MKTHPIAIPLLKKPAFSFCVLILLIVGGLAPLGCGRVDPADATGPPEDTEETGAPAEATQVASLKRPGANLILICIDTLRADRLGCYGYDRETSPAIDALARRGVRFDRVVAESSWTLPSHATLFTGLFPGTHGVTDPKKSLSKDTPTLPELLRNQGYRTRASVGGGYVGARFGFGRGFEVYDERAKSLTKTLAQAQGWIDSFDEDEPYFLFLHTYDVHCPYDPAEAYAQRFQTTPKEDHVKVRGRCGNPHFNSMDLNAGQARFLSDQYDAGIRQADDQLGQFFDSFSKDERWKNTVVILLSDHGEEFLEHGQIGHERTLHVESLLVPLIVIAPDLEPRVVSQSAGLVDVLPTLTDILGLPAPPMQGRSLVPRLVGTPSTGRGIPRFSEIQNPERIRSVLHGNHHYIFQDTPRMDMLFDLSDDYREQHNLATSAPDRLRELRSQLGAHHRALSKPQDTGNVTHRPEEEQHLRAIGYGGE